MLVRIAALLLCACMPGARGECERDADCAGAPDGSFCAEGTCQSPPRGRIDPLPARAFARAETLHLRVRIDRAHGEPSAHVVIGDSTISARRDSGGAWVADVPLRLVAPGVEGPVPFVVRLRDDLGHVTDLAAAVTVDDRPPRVTVEPAAAPVIRGTKTTLRLTAQDLGAVDIPGAVKNADGSFDVTIDTATAPAAATLLDVPITAIDASGNATLVHAAVPVTRLKWLARHPASSPIDSLVLGDTTIWAVARGGEIWSLDRSTGTGLARQPAGGATFGQIATDGMRLFFARTGDQICSLGMHDLTASCSEPIPTLAGGPILSGSTAIVGTTGTSPAANRLFAWSEDGATLIATQVLDDFSGTTPAISPTGTIHAGAGRTVVAARLDGARFDSSFTAASARYSGMPAFRGGHLLLATSGALHEFAIASAAPTIVSIAAPGVDVSSPTVAEDGTVTVTTTDRRVVALNPDESLRWSVQLADVATAPPAHGAGGLVYVGTAGGTILALDVRTGETVWSHAAGAPVHGSLAPGCDGVLYASIEGGVLALVTDFAGLAPSPWPRLAHDVRGTGDARRLLRDASGACVE